MDRQFVHRFCPSLRHFASPSLPADFLRRFPPSCRLQLLKDCKEEQKKRKQQNNKKQNRSSPFSRTSAPISPPLSIAAPVTSKLAKPLAEDENGLFCSALFAEVADRLLEQVEDEEGKSSELWQLLRQPEPYSKRVVLVRAYSRWNPTCLSFHKTLDRLITQHSSTHLRYLQFDAEHNPKLCSLLHIKQTPVVQFRYAGKLVQELAAPTVKEMEHMIADAISIGSSATGISLDNLPPGERLIRELIAAVEADPIDLAYTSKLLKSISQEHYDMLHSPEHHRLAARVNVLLFDDPKLTLEEVLSEISLPADSSQVTVGAALYEPCVAVDEFVYVQHVPNINNRGMQKGRLSQTQQIQQVEENKWGWLYDNREVEGMDEKREEVRLSLRRGRLHRIAAAKYFRRGWFDDSFEHALSAQQVDIARGVHLDHLSAERIPLPSRAMLQSIVMALGANDNSVARAMAELDAMSSDVPHRTFEWKRAKSATGGLPKIIKGKEKKWLWQGPDWKPPWASKWGSWSGPNEWSWTGHRQQGEANW
eukprot:GHVS01038828.1.p1 GENE.GHVS01038828.1~~GHVS01038828.1.p1  ORF type:complete len:535 (-),score=86.20 GHVS01038828.1:94-1698(-)